jgi:hypothetical protein
MKQLVLGVGLALPLLAAALVAYARGPLLQVAVVQVVAPRQAAMVEVNDCNYRQELQLQQGPFFIWVKNPHRILRMQADGKLVEQMRRRYASRVKFAFVDLGKFEECKELAAHLGVSDADSGSLTFYLRSLSEDGNWGNTRCVFGYGRRRIEPREIEELFDEIH